MWARSPALALRLHRDLLGLGLTPLLPGEAWRHRHMQGEKAGCYLLPVFLAEGN